MLENYFTMNTDDWLITEAAIDLMLERTGDEGFSEVLNDFKDCFPTPDEATEAAFASEEDFVDALVTLCDQLTASRLAGEFDSSNTGEQVLFLIACCLIELTPTSLNMCVLDQTMDSSTYV